MIYSNAFNLFLSAQMIRSKKENAIIQVIEIRYSPITTPVYTATYNTPINQVQVPNHQEFNNIIKQHTIPISESEYKSPSMHNLHQTKFNL